MKNRILTGVLFAILSFSALSQSAAAEEGMLDQMISPVTNPVLFEDPRSQTSLRPIYMYHKIPGDFITGSGDVPALGHAGALCAN